MKLSVDCIFCLIERLYRFIKIVDLGYNEVKIIFKYIVDNIGEKPLYEIHYGSLKLINLFDSKKKLLSLRRRIFLMTKKLYDIALSITSSIRSMGIEDVLSRTIILSILVDDPWFFIESKTDNIDYTKLSSILSNPAPPGLEVLKVIDYMPSGSSLAYFPGSLASLWVDKLFITMLAEKNIDVNVYIYNDLIGFQQSLGDLKDALMETSLVYHVLNKPADISFELFKAIRDNDLILIRNPIGIDCIIEKLEELKDIALANKIILVFRWKCPVVENILGYVHGKYFVISTDLLISKLFL
ncbi:hypothetical protein J4526_00930 [Desulfurococcaceae archaeon MEX13E-LK6-19]|nr:hypothetical protein J4526_00930 [Desulfurococcaceae archaeon MEX13E-LK6-19]